jgi:hypothetical protein
MIRAECRTNKQMHELDEELDNNSIKHVRASIVSFGSRGWEIRPVDQAEVSVGLITPERTPGCEKPRIPFRMLRIEIARHQDVETST